MRSAQWSAGAHRGGRALAALLVVTGCVAHPVGPARDLDGFRRKASTTVESALSAVQTVRLLAEAGADGKVLAAYAAVAVSEQEDALGGVRGTFMSIQPPPGAEADAIRTEVSAALTDAFDHVGDVRIAVRRGDLGDLDVVARPLDGDVDALEALEAELS